MSGLIVSPFATGAATCHPICASCKIPVEKYTLDTSSPFVLKMFVECHGRSEHIGIDIKEALAKKWVLAFKRKAFNATNMRAVP